MTKDVELAEEDAAERGAAVSRFVPYAFIFLFVAFAAAFLVAPTAMLAGQAVSGEHGLTWEYLADLGQYQYLVAFRNSIVLSAISALVGVVAGGLLAYTVLQPGAPRGLRSAVTSFSAVAANFGGVPLAFGFVATLGSLGLLTQGLRGIGLDIYAMGFRLYTVTGLAVVYAYFQVPLMVIIITPALQALKPAWREACENLGATPAQYWRMVGLPVLLPSLFSSFILLFGSSFSAYATAYALTSGNLPLLTTAIGNVLSGDVMSSPQVGAALSVGMIVVMVAVLGLSAALSRRASRWHV